MNEKPNYDLDGKIVLGRSGEDKFVPLRVNDDGELIIQGGGGGGDFPAPHAWTHLPDGTDPIQKATTERFGLTSLSNSIDSDREDISATPKAVKDVNLNVIKFTEELADIKVDTDQLRMDVDSQGEQISSAEVDINELKSDVVTINDSINTITTTVNNHSQNLDNINLELPMIEQNIGQNSQDINTINQKLPLKMDANRPSNMVLNGSGFLDFSRWKNIGAGNFLTIRDQSGIPYFSYETATTSSYAILESDPILVYPNETYNLSAEFYQVGQNGSIWIEVLNVSNNSSLGILVANSLSWHRLNIDFNTSSAVNIKLRLVVNINKSASFKAWRKIQITYGSGMKNWNVDGDFYALNSWQKWKLTDDLGKSFFQGTTNANDYLYNGEFTLFSNSQNIPPGDDIYMKVERYDRNGVLRVVQRAYQFNTPSLFIRVLGVSGWTPWSSNLVELSKYITPGSGSPEGVLTKPVGSLYLRLDGATQNALYVKQSGMGNVGWVAK